MIDPVTLAVINGRLEQISGWLSQEQGLQVSHEWIHQHVHADKRRGGEFHIHLRCRKLRRKRYGSHDRRGQIRGRIPIDKRPGLVEERSRISDWEADTVIEKLGGSVLVTLAEHKTRYSVIAKAPATQQPTPKMSWLQDSKSAILWNQPTCCTFELNP